MGAPRVALVHDWLTGMRGGERCLEVACELFPDAPLFTLLHDPGSVSPAIEDRRIVTSFIQRLPKARQLYRQYLPLFPFAIERLDLGAPDVVLSFSHCVAKGVPVASGAFHVSYCFTPMRYVWDLYDDYFGRRASVATRVIMPPLAAWLRAWDRKTARTVDRFLAISRHVGERIQRAYGRDSQVLYPPVDTRRFRVAEGRGDYYLVVSALVPYKRVDLAVRAANRLNRRLLVVGTGPEERRLRALAGPDVELLGWRADAEVAELYAGCRAVLFPGVEDFGIVPLEAAAAGRPTIALARGGVLETMVGYGDTASAGSGASNAGEDDASAPPTAVFFRKQTIEHLVEAILTFESVEDRFDRKALRARAERFDRPRFRERLAAYVERAARERDRC